MRVAALIYAGSPGERALLPLASGPSAFERSLAFVRSLPGLGGCLVLAGEGEIPDPGFPLRRAPAWTDASILEAAIEFRGSLAEAPEALVLLRADEPLLDRALARKMLDSFERYRAEYVFADGYPAGLAVEILHPRILEQLHALALRAPAPAGRGWLFEVLQRDINAFDIETEIAPKDLRDRRLTLACDTKRNVLLLERLIAAGVSDAATALEVIPDRPELLRTLPAFVTVQVTGGCLQSCRLCPWPLVGGDILSRRDHMDARRFAALMSGLADFVDDAVVDLSSWGEPSLHPDFPALVDAVLAHPRLSLIVETSGLGWERKTLEAIARAHPARIDWIVSLDAATKATYGKLRGEGWEEAQAAVETLFALWPEATHPQMVRTKENEEELESFWRGWKKRSDKLIVQKYSPFLGRLPDLKVADLSPLVRSPCWHLVRDLDILLDGRVVPCWETFGEEGDFGTLFEGLGAGEAGEPARFAAALAAAWERAGAWHRAHVEGRLPEPCSGCDEYYTYNA